MMISSAHQLTVLGLSVLVGAACGVLYTFLSAARTELGAGAVLSAAADLLFWIASGAALIWLGLRFNDGGIRAYQLIAAVMGFLLHGLCLGRITMKIARLFMRVVGVILFPLIFLFRGLSLYIKEIYEKIKRIREKIGKNLGRATAIQRTRKKMRKKYKKML